MATDDALLERLSGVAGKLGVTSEEAVTALEALAASTPVGAQSPSSSLTEAEAAVLREAGSLSEALPAVTARASTRAAIDGLALLADALTVKEAAARLSVSEGRIRQRLAAGTLLGANWSSTWRLPAFQFTERGELRGLDRVLRAMPRDVHPLVVQSFLSRPNPDLVIDGEPVTPKDWLISGGGVEPVVEVASDLHRLP